MIRSRRLRVAFTLIGGDGWTGGARYLENLLAAIGECEGSELLPLLFVGEDVDRSVIERLTPLLVSTPIVDPIWNKSGVRRLLRFFLAFIFQRDILTERVFRRFNIDVVFQHQAWYGCRFSIPTLAWIADFQHRQLPEMFSATRYWWRDVGYRALSSCATQIMLSSNDARSDCERYYPRSLGKISVVPFAVKATHHDNNLLISIRALYGLPDKFFYLPNQFWKHKNHVRVIEALRILTTRGTDIYIIVSGGALDHRHPSYVADLFQRINDYQLEERFRIIGKIPYDHVIPIMKMSVAVLNPSLCEGWSTTVEEAKANRIPLVISNLPVHVEQAGDIANFFDPNSVEDIARVLEESWSSIASGANPRCLEASQLNWRVFSDRFVEACRAAGNEL